MTLFSSLDIVLDRETVREHPTVPLASTSRTVAEMFLARTRRTPDALAWKRKAAGHWVETTFGELGNAASSVATWLGDRGVAAGDKVCIVGGTRPEWCIADMGGLSAGAVTVGAYPTLAPSQLVYVLDHSDARVAFIEGRAELDKILPHKAELPKLEQLVVWDTAGLEKELAAHSWLVPWSEVVRTRPDAERIAERVASVRPETAAIIVYTSGTTGPPKGAMISHENILVLLAGQRSSMFGADDIGLSFLPMAHVAERVLAFYGRIDHGTATAFASSIPKVLEELKEVRPTFFGGVPRIFEKAYARIQGEVAKAPPGRQRMFRWAERTGLEVVGRWQRGERIPLGLAVRYRLADRLVFTKIRAAFGGRVRFFVTGAAPIPRKVLDFFWAVGFPVYELFGMTEATVVTHTNEPGATRLGSVGKARRYVETKLADDGEILLRGKVVFLGYYKNEEATREAVDADGWLHTGDIGKIDPDGFLYIVDRKKHIIITSGGKNLTPANIENEIKAEDPLIGQVHAHGDMRAYVTALVTLGALESIELAHAHGILTDENAVAALKRALLENPLARPAGLAEVQAKVALRPEVRERIVAAVRRANARLARVEQVKRVYLLDRELSIEEDEITPTLKVKRKNLEKKFAATFDRLYEDATTGLVVIDG